MNFNLWEKATLSNTTADELLALPRDLGDGLTLRWGRASDIDIVAEFNRRLHSDTAEPDMGIHHWIYDLLSGDHPTVSPSDFSVVVDEKQGGKLVSSLNLISQTWAYEGIPFGVGRPELVATEPEYRRKRLIRTQMELIHALSAHRGELVQAITGIPWYYRQFSYEMALDWGGERRLLWPNSTRLKPDEAEVFRLRPATTADIEVLQLLYERHCQSSMISRVRDDAQWRYELSRPNEVSLGYHGFYLIETLPGQAVGYFEAIAVQQEGPLAVRELAVLPGHSLRAVGEFLSRALQKLAEEINRARQGELTPAGKPRGLLNSTSFWLGPAHPVYEALGSQLEKPSLPYAWYIRVADLPAFLRRIAPALEKRLAESVMAGHSGTLRLNFYRAHHELNFEGGKLSGIGSFTPEYLSAGDALFPGLTFLHLLFGHRSLDELRYAFADCRPNNERATVLLNILFPKKPSAVVSLL